MAGGSIAAPLLKDLPESTKTANRAAQQFALGFPPQHEVGHVTDHTFVVVYVWNGSGPDTILTGIGGGVDLDGITWDVVPPIAMLQKQSLRIVFDVSVDGPLVFDDTLTITALCRAITFRLYGTRAPHLSGDIGYLFIPHNWKDGLTESLTWKTDVLVAHDRTEQRIKLRTHPRRVWDLQFLASGAARRKLETWIGLRKTRYLFSPVWQDVSRTIATVQAGDSTVYLDDPQLLDFYVGRPMALFSAWDHFEIRNVQGVGSNYVSVDAPFSEEWPLWSMVAPCRLGLGIEQRRISRFTEDVGEFTVRFEALAESLEPALATPDTYLGTVICPLVPSWVNDQEETIDNKWVRLDNDTGVIEYDIQSIEPVLSRDARFMLVGRDKIDMFMRFLFYCSGRLAPFWIPGADRCFELVEPAYIGETSILINSVSYEYALNGSPAREHIELITTGGTIIRRRITAVETLPTGEERLSLDSAIQVDISDATLNRCAWLELCRLDMDSIDLQWFTGDCVEATLQIMVLP